MHDKIWRSFEPILPTRERYWRTDARHSCSRHPVWLWSNSSHSRSDCMRLVGDWDPSVLPSDFWDSKIWQHATQASAARLSKHFNPDMFVERKLTPRPRQEFWNIGIVNWRSLITATGEDLPLRLITTCSAHSVKPDKRHNNHWLLKLLMKFLLPLLTWL
mgnify:CR=1 FL=1